MVHLHIVPQVDTRRSGEQKTASVPRASRVQRRHARLRASPDDGNDVDDVDPTWMSVLEVRING